MMPDNVEVARMRWRCRRGLLELDIVLGGFVERYYANLSVAEKVSFDTLLELPDNALWDRITGKEKAENEVQKKLLELIGLKSETPL